MFENFKNVKIFKDNLSKNFPKNEISFKEIIDKNFIPYLHIFINNEDKNIKINLENFMDYSLLNDNDLSFIINSTKKSINEII